MKSSYSINGWNSLAVNFHGAAAGEGGDLCPPTEAIKVQICHTIVTEKLGKIENSGQDSSNTSSCLEECLYVFLRLRFQRRCTGE